MMSQGHPLAGGFTGLAQGAQQQFRNDLLTQEQQRLQQAQALENQLAQARLGLAQTSAGYTAADRSAAEAQRAANVQFLMDTKGLSEAEAKIYAPYMDTILEKTLTPPDMSKRYSDIGGRPFDNLTGKFVESDGAGGFKFPADVSAAGPDAEKKYAEKFGADQAELVKRGEAAALGLRNTIPMMEKVAGADERVFGPIDNSSAVKTFRNLIPALSGPDITSEQAKLEADYMQRAQEYLATQSGVQTDSDRLAQLKALGSLANVPTGQAGKEILLTRAAEMSRVAEEAGVALDPEVEAFLDKHGVRGKRDSKASTTAAENADLIGKANKTLVFDPETNWFKK
jgi:hypothetical protein